MVMSKSLDEELPTLNLILEKLRKVPGIPNELTKEREFHADEKGYKNRVKWIQQAIKIASYVSCKYDRDILYYVYNLARHINFLYLIVQR